MIAKYNANIGLGITMRWEASEAGLRNVLHLQGPVANIRRILPLAILAFPVEKSTDHRMSR